MSVNTLEYKAAQRQKNHYTARQAEFMYKMNKGLLSSGFVPYPDPRDFYKSSVKNIRRSHV